MYSNGYIFRYASIMVIVAAALLSSAAIFLKPMQEENMAIEKMGGILESAKVEGVVTENTIDMFNEYVIESLVVNQEGIAVETQDTGSMQNGTAFKLNLKEQLYKKSKGEPYQMPIYVINYEEKKLYIFPLMGSGLWGNLYGNLALEKDFSTIYAVTFSHDKETPGLGAEITEPNFTKPFENKQIFDEQGKFAKIKVVKGKVAALPAADQNHAVSAITGGTITSVGVEEMLDNVLQAYLPYINKQRK